MMIMNLFTPASSFTAYTDNTTVSFPMQLCSNINGNDCDDDGDIIMGDAQLENLIYKMGQMSVVFDYDSMDIEDDMDMDMDMDIEEDPIMDDLVHMMSQLTVKEDPMDSLIDMMGGLSMDDDDDSMDIEDDDDMDMDMDIEDDDDDDDMDSLIKMMGELSIH